MKFFILLLVPLCASTLSQGQTVNFRYDASGHRTSRTVILLKSTAAANNQEKPEEEVLTEQIGDKEILIYPNPVRSELIVSINGFAEVKEASISLFDQGGRLLLKLDNVTESNLISLSHLSQGNYFMIIRLDGSNTKWTIVKE